MSRQVFHHSKLALMLYSILLGNYAGGCIAIEQSHVFPWAALCQLIGPLISFWQPKQLLVGVAMHIDILTNQNI